MVISACVFFRYSSKQTGLAQHRLHNPNPLKPSFSPPPPSDTAAGCCESVYASYFLTFKSCNGQVQTHTVTRENTLYSLIYVISAANKGSSLESWKPQLMISQSCWASGTWCKHHHNRTVTSFLYFRLLLFLVSLTRAICALWEPSWVTFNTGSKHRKKLKSILTLKAPIHFRTQSDEPIICHEKPVKSCIVRCHWSSPLVSRSNWSDRRTMSESGSEPLAATGVTEPVKVGPNNEWYRQHVTHF